MGFINVKNSLSVRAFVRSLPLSLSLCLCGFRLPFASFSSIRFFPISGSVFSLDLCTLHRTLTARISRESLALSRSLSVSLCLSPVFHFSQDTNHAKVPCLGCLRRVFWGSTTPHLSAHLSFSPTCGCRCQFDFQLSEKNARPRQMATRFFLAA